MVIVLPASCCQEPEGPIRRHGGPQVSHAPERGDIGVFYGVPQLRGSAVSNGDEGGRGTADGGRPESGSQPPSLCNTRLRVLLDSPGGDVEYFADFPCRFARSDPSKYFSLTIL